METEILQKLISLDSQCLKSNREIIDYISDKLKHFEVKKFNFDKERGLSNLIVKIPGENSDNPIIFLGHVDTVQMSKDWTRDPFKATIENGKVYGLGASDMKAGLACIIWAALNIKKMPKQDIYLLFDADEEENGTGGRRMTKDFKVTGRMIIAEPSNHQIIYSNKGCFNAQIEIRGKEKHSAQANFDYCKKESAINKAVIISNKLLDYSREIEKNNDEKLGKATMNIGKIEGGTGENIVAGRCTIGICRRIIPGESIDHEYEKICKIVKEIDQTAQVNSTFWVPSFQGNRNGNLSKDIIQASQEILPSISFTTEPITTEAGLFPKCEVLVFGPGDYNLNHKPDEYVSVSDIRDFSRIYQKLMEG